jgi:hypothetical protein
MEALGIHVRRIEHEVVHDAGPEKVLEVHSVYGHLCAPVRDVSLVHEEETLFRKISVSIVNCVGQTDGTYLTNLNKERQKFTVCFKFGAIEGT